MAKTILILFVLAGALIAPEDLSSCGPFPPETLFSGKRKPLDEARYFAGHLDIIEPHYARIYLIAAYRYLAGAGLSAADRAALFARQSGPNYWGDQASPAINAWLRMRVMVGAPPIDHIDRFAPDSQHSYYLNCGDDAFRNAAATLGAHFQAGLSHDDLRAWVAAQDQVFANCDLLGQVPAPLPAGAAPWMRADRAYQIAAAEFYGGQFDAAASDFRRIAADRSSPWHGVAPYLAARALIRKTTLIDASAAPAALSQLRTVLADPDAAPWHASARGLQRYLRIRSDPAAAFNELAHLVETGHGGGVDVTGDVMNDYRAMFDQFESHQQNVPRDADITDWILTIQNDSTGHGLEKWRATRSLPWLVAALTWADKPDPEMMAAAARVPDRSPGYLTVEFHRLRLMPADEARPRLDGVLRRDFRNWPVSARNLFLAERMRLALDWEEILRYGVRTAAGNTVDGIPTVPGGPSWPGTPREQPVTGPPMKYFDDAAAYILDREAPLAVLRHAAESPLLPENLRLEVARAAWVRSIMLGNRNMARDVAPVLASLAPYLKAQLDGYLAAADEKAANFAAAWLLLNNPGMRPAIDAGAGREAPTPHLDIYRNNWWCRTDAGRPSLNAPLNLLYQGNSPEVAFLSPAQRAEARGQQKRMDAFPAAVTFMAHQAVDWAGSHSEDPRVPESLRLAVRGLRYTCGGDAESDRWAKRAFELLHTRYPNSKAARETPYWYKNGLH